MVLFFFLLFRLFLDKRSRNKGNNKITEHRAKVKLRMENPVTAKIGYTRHKSKKNEANKKYNTEN